MTPDYKEKEDPNESRNPPPDYTRLRSKGYDKSKGRATHRGGRADTTMEGSDVDEATDDEDTDDRNSDDGDSVDGSTTD